MRVSGYTEALIDLIYQTSHSLFFFVLLELLNVITSVVFIFFFFNERTMHFGFEKIKMYLIKVAFGFMCLCEPISNLDCNISMLY